MAVKMRLMRMGDKKNPMYRVVVVDSRKAATGEYIDCVGKYHPTSNPVVLEMEAEKAKSSTMASHWLSACTSPK